MRPWLNQLSPKPTSLSSLTYPGDWTWPVSVSICVSLLCFFGYSVFHSFVPHITNRSAGGSLTYKSMLTHIRALPNGDPGGIRTRIIGVRGRPPKPLEDGAIKSGNRLYFIITCSRAVRISPRGCGSRQKSLSSCHALWWYRLSANFSLEGSIKFNNSFIFYDFLPRALTLIYSRNSCTWAGTVASTFVVRVRPERKRIGIIQHNRPQLSKSLSVKG